MSWKCHYCGGQLTSGMDCMNASCPRKTPPTSIAEGLQLKVTALEKRLAEVEAERDDARYRPLGDNHHNAAGCPHCNPKLAQDHERWRAAMEKDRTRADTAEARIGAATKLLDEAHGDFEGKQVLELIRQVTRALEGKDT